MDEVVQRFDGAFHAWVSRRLEDRPVASLEKVLLRDYRDVWERGDERRKADVLHFLGDVRPPEGEDIVWGSLRSEDRWTVVPFGLAAANAYVLHNRARPDAQAVSALVGIVNEDRDAMLRFLALHVLALAKVEGLDSWIRDLAENDRASEVRYEANRILMRKGSVAGKDALFADIRENPGHFGVADELWRHRQLFKLTEEEGRELRQVIARYVEWLRGRLHDRVENESTRKMAVGMLRRFVSDGFPFEESDVEAVGKFAVTASEIQGRLDAVDTLALINTPRAREWLEDIASRQKPRKVVDKARYLLQLPRNPE